MERIVFIAKTDLNTDGRILNQLNILIEHLNKKIDFILLPDKPLSVKLDDNVRVHEIDCIFRNNRLLRLFTVFEWTVKAFLKLLRLKPSILHIQDSAVVFPAMLYRFLRGKKVYVIYDDHELPNENSNMVAKVIEYVEKKLIRSADTVIVANEERMTYLESRLKPRGHMMYFLNLPYQTRIREADLIEEKYKKSLEQIELLMREGTRFIIHQGKIDKERGKSLIAEFSRKLTSSCKVLLVGGGASSYHSFINEYNLNHENFYFVGSVPYDVLPYYWDKAEASIIVYLPTYRNNKLCAPNRLYLSYFKSVPTITNRDNPVLYNFVKTYKAGYFMDEIDPSDFYGLMTPLDNLKSQLTAQTECKERLLNEEVNKFVKLYKNLSYKE